MKTMILFLATLISLAGCREKEDDRTLDFSLAGDWKIESVSYPTNLPEAEEKWLEVSIEIKAIDNEQFTINVPNTAYDTIWPETSVWRKISENDSTILLQITDSKSFNRSDLPLSQLDVEARIFKLSPNYIAIDRFVSELLFPGYLGICCIHKYNMKRKTE